MTASTAIDATPREVFERLVQGVSAKRWAELPDLYAEDAVVEHPLAIPAPSRLEGREQLRAHFAAAADLPVEMAARNVMVHQTADPEVIVAEFDVDGEVPATGETYRMPYVHVYRVRDGEIVSLRDYFNPAALASLPSTAELDIDPKPA